MKTLRVGVAPWLHLNPNCNPSDISGCDAGPELDILYLLTKMENVNISFLTSNEQGCGQLPDGNSSSSGLLKMLSDGKIDMIGQLCNLPVETLCIPNFAMACSVKQSVQVSPFRTKYIIRREMASLYACSASSSSITVPSNST